MTETTRRRRTRAEQQAETRARLLDAAAEAFATHGVAGASIDLITEQAGYTRGAFYSNFSDKGELLVELVTARMDRFAAQLPALLAASRPERIAGAARWLIDEEPPAEVLLLVELARQRREQPGTAELLAELNARTLGFIAELLERSPDVPADADPADRDALAHALLAGVLGLTLLRHLDVEVEPRAAELLLAGVLPGPGAHGATARDDAETTA